MPVHEFGIMPKPPIKRKSYFRYEPEKYNCISIDDDVLFAVSEKLKDIKSFWGKLGNESSGLDYYGVTMIPTESIPSFILIIKDHKEMAEFCKLLAKAETENRWIIHFGI